MALRSRPAEAEMLTPEVLEGSAAFADGACDAVSCASATSARWKNKIPPRGQASPRGHAQLDASFRAGSVTPPCCITPSRCGTPPRWETPPRHHRWLDSPAFMLDGDASMGTEVLHAALRAVVLEAVREAVRDEFLTFRKSSGEPPVCADDGGEPSQRPREPPTFADDCLEPSPGREDASARGQSAAAQAPLDAATSTQQSDGHVGYHVVRSTRTFSREVVSISSPRRRIPTMFEKVISYFPRLDDSIADLAQQEQDLRSMSFSLWSLASINAAEQWIACLIFVNAVTIGVQIDMSLRGHTELARQLQYLNWALLLVFFIELCARVYLARLEFFSCRGPNFAWNVFDLLTVASSALDVVLELASSAVRIEQVSYLRIIRILRVMKAFRVVRILPFFRELRVMVAGVLKCGKSVVWAIVLMVLVSYTFAIMVAQACPEAECKFGSLAQIIFILFQATTGGRDWGDLANDLSEFNELLALGLYLYVLVVTFVVVNVITAVFVQAALEQNQDPEEVLVDTISRRRKWLLDVQALFDNCDKDDSGCMRVDDMVHVLNQNDARSSLRILGIDADLVDMKMLHCILDMDGDGRVTLEEFAHCLQGLRGHARSSDVMILRADIKKLWHEVKVTDALSHCQRDQWTSRG